MTLLDSISDGFSTAYDSVVDTFSTHDAGSATADVSAGDSPFNGKGPLLEYANPAPSSQGGGHASGAGATDTWSPANLFGGVTTHGASGSWSIGAGRSQHGATGSWEPSTTSAPPSNQSFLGDFGSSLSFDLGLPSSSTWASWGSGVAKGFDQFTGKLLHEGQELHTGILRRTLQATGPNPDDFVDAWRETGQAVKDGATKGLSFAAHAFGSVADTGLRNAGHLAHGLTTGDFAPYVYDAAVDIGTGIDFTHRAADFLASGFKSQFLTDRNGDGQNIDEFTESSLGAGALLLGGRGMFKAAQMSPEVAAAAGDAYATRVGPYVQRYDEIHDSLASKFETGLETVSRVPNKAMLKANRYMYDETVKWVSPRYDRLQEWFGEKTAGLRDRFTPDPDSIAGRAVDVAARGGTAAAHYAGQAFDLGKNFAAAFDKFVPGGGYSGLLQKAYDIGKSTYDVGNTLTNRAKVIGAAGVGLGVATGNVDVYVNDDDAVNIFNVYPGGKNISLDFPLTGTRLSLYGNGWVVRPPWPMENAGMPTFKVRNVSNDAEGPKSAQGNISARMSPLSVGAGIQWFSTGNDGLSARSWFGVSAPQAQLGLDASVPMQPGAKRDLSASLEFNGTRAQYSSGVFAGEFGVLNRSSNTNTVSRLTKAEAKEVNWWTSASGLFKVGAEDPQKWSSTAGTLNPAYGKPEPTHPDYSLGDWFDLRSDPVDPAPRSDPTAAYLEWLNSNSDMPPPPRDK